ncbi:hypothetical protein [Caudoviricetes sp.]|nr:hypothetical protein [Caudoviricetes sp.]
MEVNGTVVSVEIDVQVAKNGGGTYPGARLAYRDENGAMKEQAFHNNVFKFNAPLKTSLSNLTPGQPFVMVKEKEKDFWNVKSIVPATASIAPPPSAGKVLPTASPKSTYETPEERAKKQVYIVRQSSITNAINLKGSKATVAEILDVAKQFESFVFGEEFDTVGVEHFKGDDIA